MSVCLVSHEHINILVQWAAEHKVAGSLPEQVVAEALEEAQCASFLAYYNHGKYNDEVAKRPKIHYQPHPAAERLETGEVLSLLSSFDYQCAYAPNFEQTAAGQWVCETQGTAERQVRGYRDTPYSIDRDWLDRRAAR